MGGDTVARKFVLGDGWTNIIGPQPVDVSRIDDWRCRNLGRSWRELKINKDKN